MSGLFSNIHISTCEIGVLVVEHTGAQVSQVHIEQPELHGIRLETTADDNHFAGIVIDTPSYTNSDTYDGISISSGDDNSFTDITILGAVHRYTADFGANTGNRLRVNRATDGVTGRFNETTLWDNDFGDIHQIPWTQAGVLSVTTGLLRIPILFDVDILEVQATVAVAPTGTAVIADVHLNGTTIFTTQGDRPTIGLAATTDKAEPNVTTAATDDYLTIDIDQIDSNAAATDLTVIVRMRRRE